MISLNLTPSLSSSWLDFGPLDEHADRAGDSVGARDDVVGAEPDDIARRRRDGAELGYHRLLLGERRASASNSASPPVVVPPGLLTKTSTPVTLSASAMRFSIFELVAVLGDRAFDRDAGDLLRARERCKLIGAKHRNAEGDATRRAASGTPQGDRAAKAAAVSTVSSQPSWGSPECGGGALRPACASRDVRQGLRKVQA